MASFTDSEKVEYALKTTLNITMSKFGYAPFNETPAPPRVFPSNVMSKDLITFGEGDIDENGAYVSGHSQTGNIDTSLTTYESVLKYYKIVCPVTKRVSKAQLSNVLGTTSSQNILGREILDIDFGYSGAGDNSATSSNFWTKPVNSNFHRLSFFRGHYIDENNASDKFNYASTHYKGLNLAWNHIADGTDVSSAIDASGNGTDVTQIVPHLKLFLQIQTAFQIGADNKENQCFGHSMMKNMLGLDFKIPVQVNVGEVSGGDTVNASATSDITGPGVASGNEWYTQSTAGTINFYAVGHSGTKVDNSKDPINFPLNSNAPLVTFLKYTGDHAGIGGLGGGGGGGGGSFMPITEDLTVTGDIYYDAGNVGIGTTIPETGLHVRGEDNQLRLQTTRSSGSHLNWSPSGSAGSDWDLRYSSDGSSAGARLWFWYNGDQRFYTNNGTDRMIIKSNGNVGIGTTSPYARFEASCGTFSGSGENSPQAYNTTAYANVSAAFTRTNTGNNNHFGLFIGNLANTGASYLQNLSTNYNNYYNILLQPNGGNVGIGATSPKERLDVGSGKICFSGNIHSGTDCGISYYHSGQSNERKILFFDTNGSTIIRSGDNSTSDGIKFQNYSGSTRMFIQDNGHVGIGHDPSYMLDVNGSVRFANCIWTQNNGNYGSVMLTGEKDGGYWGIQLGNTSQAPKLMSDGNNIGFYFDGPNSWGMYCNHGGALYLMYNGSNKLETRSNGIEVNGELYVDNWVRPMGQHGIYFESYGGGWRMQDTTWIRSYGSKPVYIDNWMCATRVQCNSTSRSGNYVLRAHHSHSISFYTAAYLGSNGDVNSNRTYTEAASAWFSGDIHVTSEVFVASDRRTKKDIEDVPDHNALEIVRNIPCRYYNYIDPQRNSDNKSIGFIAQEVLPILPTAITIKKDFLPNKLEFIKIEEWIDIDESDKSEYYYKLKSNLTDVSGVLHRFICEDISNNKEIILEEVGNEDGTFNFPSKFDRIFCYGTEVDDFHVLDKSKIFALYHSSIQEIDRLQQVDKAKIAELENKVVTLESELETIKQHLGI